MSNFLLPGLLALLLTGATPPRVILTVVAADRKATPFTATALAQAPRITVTATDKTGQPHQYEGVALHYLLTAAGVSLDRHGEAVHQALLISGNDGYRALVAVGEVMPELAPQPVMLADRCDGQPLPTAAGPWQLIVPLDRKPTRWVRQATRVVVVPVADEK